MAAKKSQEKKSDWAGLIALLVLILFVRWAIVEPFKIPSGSMLPNLLIGDHLFVSKSAYDIRIPFTNKSMIHVSDPERGDVIVFSYPRQDESAGKFFIKRLVGVPGDKITIRAGVPYFDSVVTKQTPADQELASKLPAFEPRPAHYLVDETLPGRDHSHIIQRDGEQMEVLPLSRRRLYSHTGKDCIEIGSAYEDRRAYMGPWGFNEICEFEIPEGYFLMMGDNRDHSSDSRFFGLVPRDHIKGKAVLIWLSLPLSGHEMQQSLVPSIVSHVLSFFKMFGKPDRLARVGRGLN